MENGHGYFKITDVAEHFGKDRTSTIEFRLSETPLEIHFAKILKKVLDDKHLCEDLRTWITNEQPLGKRRGLLFKGNFLRPSSQRK